MKAWGPPSPRARCTRGAPSEMNRTSPPRRPPGPPGPKARPERPKPRADGAEPRGRTDRAEAPRR
eukprot:4490474-Alexandrium_andersonii.AAC.1